MRGDRLIVEGSFDPISFANIASIRKERTDLHLNKLCFLIRNDVFDSYRHPSLQDKEERLREVFKDREVLFVNDDHSLHPVNHPECPYLRIDDGEDNLLIREGKARETPFLVFQRILEKDFYFLSKRRKLRKSSRFSHSKEVAKTAYEIASHASLDVKKAFLAGLYHDLAKDLPYEEQLALVKEGSHPEFSSLPAFAIHQAASPELRKKTFSLDDGEIYDARLFHCTGKAERSERQKVIYSADKVEPTRKFKTEENRKTLMENLDSGFIHLLRANVEYFRRNSISYKDTPLSAQRYAYYLGDKHA